MAPKTVKPINDGAKRKGKNVMNIKEKLLILDLLRSGERVASVAKRYNVNESTVRSIRNCEESIRDNASRLGSRAEYAKVSRNSKLVKMEDMLINWLQDSVHNKVPVNSVAIRDQAVNFYSQLKENSVNSNSNESFCASKGWFERFKSRFSLIFAPTGEIISLSADQPGSQEYSSRQLLSEEIYFPEQILNNDETVPALENVPARAYLVEDPLNASWSKFLPEIVVKEKLSNAVSSVLQDTETSTEEMCSDGFDTQDSGLVDPIFHNNERSCVTVTLNHTGNHTEEDKDKTKDDEEETFTIAELSSIFKKMENVIKIVQEQDPDMKRSLKFKHDCEMALLPYQELHRDLLREKKKKHSS